MQITNIVKSIKDVPVEVDAEHRCRSCKKLLFKSNNDVFIGVALIEIKCHNNRCKDPFNLVRIGSR
jgi:phage FluMu protein Com